MVSKVPAIPSVPMGVDPALTMYLNSVKSALDVLAGGSSEKAITQAELDAALAKLELSGGGGGTTIISGGGGGTNPTPPDTTPPAAPTGLVAYGGFSTIILEWDALPPSPPIAFVTVYRAAVNDFTQAAAVGTSRVLLYSDYVPDSQNYYYWIRFTTEAGVQGPVNSGTGTIGKSSLDPSYTKEVLKGAITDLEIAAEKLSGDGALQELTIQSANIADAAILTAKIGEAAIVTAHIQDAAIVDAKIQSLTADKIVASSLSAVSANLGTVTAGLMESPDKTFRIDLSNKQMLITGPAGQAADDYLIVENGAVRQYEWTGSGHVLSKALRGLAVGVANNGDTVTMSNQYFRDQPRIIVSPASIPTYLVANSAQDQTLQCIAQNITEVGDGIWEFEAVAQLALSGGSEVQALAITIPNSGLNTISTSAVATLGSSANKLTVNVTTRSYRSTTTAGTFYKRKVTLYLQYRIAGSGAGWLNGASAIVNFVNETSEVVSTLATGTLPAQRYEVRVTAIYADAGGTFVGSGGSATPQPPVTVTASNQTINQNGPGYPSGIFQLPAWSAVGATNISVAYSFVYSATATAQYLFAAGPNTATLFATGGTDTQLATATANAQNPGAGNPVTGTGSGTYNASDTGSYNRNKLGWRMSLTQQSDGQTSGQIVATQIKAVINYSLPTTSGDTNPHNWLTWNTLTARLAGSTVLSEGTLNWMAIGEG